MPRTARVAPGGMPFHVLNRGVGRMPLFLKDADFQAFERIVEKTLETCPMRICAYCLMSNHGHLYQGRYKSFPREADDHFYQVVRYVERNAPGANLVRRAEDWRWTSLWGALGADLV